VVTIFGKTWDLHVRDILDISLAENLAMIRDSVAYLKLHGKEVIYDAEHFFDGYKNNAAYARKTIEAALVRRSGLGRSLRYQRGHTSLRSHDNHH